jgi:hypothetical protein
MLLPRPRSLAQPPRCDALKELFRFGLSVVIGGTTPLFFAKLNPPYEAPAQRSPRELYASRTYSANPLLSFWLGGVANA